MTIIVEFGISIFELELYVVASSIHESKESEFEPGSYILIFPSQPRQPSSFVQPP